MDSADIPTWIDPDYGRAIGVAHLDESHEPLCFQCHVSAYTDRDIDPGDTYFVFDSEPGANRKRCPGCGESLWSNAEAWYQTHHRPPDDLCF